MADIEGTSSELKDVKMKTKQTPHKPRFGRQFGKNKTTKEGLDTELDSYMLKLPNQSLIMNWINICKMATQRCNEETKINFKNIRNNTFVGREQ